MEVGQLADTIAAKLSEQILGSLKVDSIVNTLMEKMAQKWKRQ